MWIFSNSVDFCYLYYVEVSRLFRTFINYTVEKNFIHHLWWWPRAYGVSRSACAQ